MMVEPPRLARGLLRLIPQPDREFIEGDLEEEHALRVAELGRRRAAAWYWNQVLATLPPVVHDAAIKLLDRPISFPELQRRVLVMASSLGGPASTATARRIAFGRRLLASRPPREEGTLATSFMSLVVHVGLFGGLVYGTIDAGPKEEPREIQVIDIVQPLEENEPPPPPTEGAVPEESMIPELVVPNEIPIVIPPPGVAIVDPDSVYKRMLELANDSSAERSSEVVDIGEQPTFTPFEVAPDLRNRDEVGRALQREYPSLLRDAGVGGTVEVWIFLDEQGSVANAQVNVTSGQKTLDDAALRVAQIMEFSPAMNRDKAVPVWVKIPITFQVR